MDEEKKEKETERDDNKKDEEDKDEDNMDEEKKEKETEKNDEDVAEKKDEEQKEQESEEDEVEEEAAQMEEPEQEPPKAELTAEEEKQFFRRTASPDLTPAALSTSFLQFSMPEKDEGFDEVRQDWLEGAKCTEYLKQWVQDRKLTTRIEDLQPSEWFQTKHKEWGKVVQGWHTKLNEHKAALARKAAEKVQKEAKKKAAIAAKVARDKLKEVEAAKKGCG